jgi:hypothetical protein
MPFTLTPKPQKPLLWDCSDCPDGQITGGTVVSSLGSGQVGQYSQAFARGLAPPCLLGDAAEAWRR